MWLNDRRPNFLTNHNYGVAVLLNKSVYYIQFDIVKAFDALQGVLPYTVIKSVVSLILVRYKYVFDA